jgi:hypothetical protein
VKEIVLALLLLLILTSGCSIARLGFYDIPKELRLASSKIPSNSSITPDPLIAGSPENSPNNKK